MCPETANIRRIDAPNRRLVCRRRRAGNAAAVPKSTSCSVIRTSVDAASSAGATEGARTMGSYGAFAVPANAVLEYDISFVSLAVCP
jgi:hypothetical protein